MTKYAGISAIDGAGKHLVKSRNLQDAAASLTAVQAAHSSDPDVQALAVLSVLLARVTGAQHDGWVLEICSTLGLPEVERD